jgi:hypothetical protein
MFFELRMYRSQPGQRDALAKLMDEVVIPFQSSRGMVVVGSFVSLEEDDLYIWMRRFDSEEQREALYKAVYEDPQWTEVISPQWGRCSIAARSRCCASMRLPSPSCADV